MRTRKSSRPATTGRLHPLIFRILMAAVVAWAVITFAFFLGGTGYGGWIGVIVAFFAAVVLLIPWRMGYIQRHHSDENAAPPPSPLREWLSKRFEIWQGSTTGLDALVSILLPAVVAVIGGVIFAIIFHLEG